MIQTAKKKARADAITGWAYGLLNVVEILVVGVFLISCVSLPIELEYYKWCLMLAGGLFIMATEANVFIETHFHNRVIFIFLVALWVLTCLWMGMTVIALIVPMTMCEHDSMCDPNVYCYGSACSGVDPAVRYGPYTYPSARFITVFIMAALMLLMSCISIIVTGIQTWLLWRAKPSSG
jgi:hypothetical protein